MFFPDRRLIFIHIPKTGGNFFARAFLAQSADRLQVRPEAQHDGVERFGLSGAVTRRKHQTVREYMEALGGDLTGYRLLAIARAPVDRMASLYYSPHRWLKAGADGAATVDAGAVAFNPQSFRRMVEQAPSSSQILDIRPGDPVPRLGCPARHHSGAEIQLLPFAGLSDALAAFAAAEGFDPPDFPPAPVNASAAPEARDSLARDAAELADLVRASHHRADEAFFAAP